MPYNKMFMERALRLAAMSDARVQPNPYVGAVVVKNGRVIGEGRHRVFGGPHAEVEALDIPRGDACGAELYVTLEPCSHQGKTPPCTDLIIEKGIYEVHVAMEDPNPLVNGRGVARLREKGIVVTTGHEEARARFINRVFIKNMRFSEPYVILKYAMTADGFIAASSGDSGWISGEKSRDAVHLLRHNVGAVLVGSGTVLADDPLLSARKVPGGWQPRKVILDGDGLINDPVSHRVFADGTGVYIGQKNLDIPGFRFYNFDKDGGRFEKTITDILKSENISSLLVEGGASVLTAFIESRFFDEVNVFIAPKLLGGGISPVRGKQTAAVKEALELRDVSWEFFEGDAMMRGYK